VTPDDPTARSFDVAVCVCAYRRPEELARLLRAVAELEFRDTPAPVLGVVVLDNDPDGAARPVVEEAGRGSGLVVEYVPVGRGNISAARNAALEAGGGLAPLLAFIDDDEVPEAHWLDQMLSVHRRTGSPIVIGPVFSRFDRPVPDWIERGGFFDLPTFADGAALTEGITGNALVEVDRVVAAGLTFDEDLGRSGGEDQLFFRTARSRGLDIRYAAGATVHEWVAPDRVGLRYLLRREYRKGNTLGLFARRYPETGERIPVRLAKALKWTGQGSVEIVVSPLSGGRAGAAGGLLRMARAAGMVAGMGDRPYQAYAGGGRRRWRRLRQAPPG
jgi:glycosyltransferase involved in cell wall biosynthesis